MIDMVCVLRDAFFRLARQPGLLSADPAPTEVAEAERGKFGGAAKEGKEPKSGSRNFLCDLCVLLLPNRFLSGLLILLLFLFSATPALAQPTPGAPPSLSLTNSASGLNFNLNLPGQPRDVDIAIRIVFIMTLLTLAPSLVMLMTSFTRIVIVFSFLRSAMGLHGTPASQLLIGFSLFMTFFIMAPTYQRVNADALQPYSAGQITSQEALQRASDHMKTFMLSQARTKDMEVFVGLAGMGPTTPDQLPMRVVIPGFVLSELRTGFQMGFLLFIPFILIDFVVAIVLMSLGLMMLPPALISMPLKILLFVLVDGWTLLVRSLAVSFQ